MEFSIRDLRPDEYQLLDDFLYEAIFIPEGEELPPRSVTELPELRMYVDGFGSQKRDYALAAEFDGRIAGAVWTRIIPDYGHIDDDTPSFAISLYPEFRGIGAGTALMRAMLERLRAEGWRHASLSVQKANYAARMYFALGFRVYRDNPDEYVMIIDL